MFIRARNMHAACISSSSIIQRYDSAAAAAEVWGVHVRQRGWRAAGESARPDKNANSTIFLCFSSRFDIGKHWTGKVVSRWRLVASSQKIHTTSGRLYGSFPKNNLIF
jgi:hypothetical protein